MRLLRTLFVFIVLGWNAPVDAINLTINSLTIAESAVVNTDHLRTQLLSSLETVAPGQAFWVALRMQHAPAWHSYWRVAGDSGLPTEIHWKLPEGWQASEIYWPRPQRIAYGDLINYGLQDEALLLVQIKPATKIIPGTVTLQAQANWLVCREVCIPGQGSYQLSLKINQEIQPSIWQDRLQRGLQALPLPLNAATDWAIKVNWTDKGIELQMQPRGQNILPQTLTFFPYEAERINNAAHQHYAIAENKKATLTILPQTTPPVINKTPWTHLKGLLVADSGKWQGSIDLPIQGQRPAQFKMTQQVLSTQATVSFFPSSPTLVQLSLWGALLGAFFGGLILNLMPCVFPVLSIKILSAMQYETHHPGSLHRHGLLYTGGVLTGFLGLAIVLLVLREAGNQLGWGFHLQNPWAILFLMVLFTLIGFNLLGWFELRWGQSAATQLTLQTQPQLHPYLSAFATGLLAVVVASPCSAPFMGAALGFALTQPTSISLGIFIALGLGLAAPYLLLCYLPAIRQRLPRPGPWMQNLKHALAVPMFLTVAWLIWVYGLLTNTQAQIAAFFGLLIMGLVFSWRTHKQAYLMTEANSRSSRRWFVIASILSAVTYIGLIHYEKKAQAEIAWQPYSEKVMQIALAQQKTVFVDFTAAWCITCQVNKHAVLDDDTVKQALQKSGWVLLRADWTQRDPEITTALQRLGRNGVPVYWLQRPNAPPKLLPELLTTGTMLEVLQHP